MTRTLKYAAESSVTTTLVLVTEPEFRRAERVFSAVSDLQCRPVPSAEKELAAVIQETRVRHIVVGGVIYRDALYASLPRGAVLARFGVGFDGLDLVKATAAGLICTNTPDVLTQSTAELAILLLMASA